MPGESLLRLEGAAFGYGGDPVIQGVDLEIRAGDFILLTGPNGCGKTTLLRGLLGLSPSASGKLERRIPRHRIGYVPQEAGMEAGGPATALDVVRTALPLAWGAARGAAGQALERVGLGGHSRLPYASLSGGQKRRVLVARALAADPALLILDEPIANVDDATARHLDGLLADLCAAGGKAVLAASHDPGWGRGARNLRVENGRLIG